MASYFHVECVESARERWWADGTNSHKLYWTQHQIRVQHISLKTYVNWS